MGFHQEQAALRKQEVLRDEKATLKSATAATQPQQEDSHSSNTATAATQPQQEDGTYTSTSVSQSGPYRPPGGVEEMQGGGRRVRLEWGAYITV
ncbi:hypothetical protein FHG87_006991 [Trinorchestia longiramus]|nr:hypothetical protein FHG87_006991 [Trinorchestia longiramus]